MTRAMTSVAMMAVLAAVTACSGKPQSPRHDKFEAIGKATKALGAELKKDAPDLAVIKTNAESIDSSAKALPSWFPGTTGPEPDVKTEAKAEIWQKPAEFKAAAGKFAAAAAALKSAADAGDIAAVKTAAAALGPTCKGCHDSFRAKE
jgi:cytochrome c556